MMYDECGQKTVHNLQFQQNNATGCDQNQGGINELDKEGNCLIERFREQ